MVIRSTEQLKRTRCIPMYLLAGLFMIGCNPGQEKIERNISPQIVEVNKLTVPTDSVAPPVVNPVDEGALTHVMVSETSIGPARPHVKPAGEPHIVKAGLPVICTMGQDTFSLPDTLQITGKVVPAGRPEVVFAAEMSFRDHNPAGFSYFNRLHGLTTDMVRDIHQDDKGNMWFGMIGGLVKYDGRTFSIFTEAQGLSNNNVTGITEDQAGNLLISTNGGGICKYDGFTFTHFTETEGFPSNLIFRITSDSEGNIWITASGKGMVKYTGKNFINYTAKQGLVSNFIPGIGQDYNGNLWFGTSIGLSKFDGKSFYNYTQAQGLPNNVVYSIVPDSLGNIWIGSDGGVSRFDGNQFATYTMEDGLPMNSVFDIFSGKNNILWLGTYMGLSKFDGMTFTNYTQAEGLSNNFVSRIYEDRSANLWFGTTRGVTKSSSTSFTHFSGSLDMPYDEVYSIEMDNKENLWFGTANLGVYKYDGSQITKLEIPDYYSNHRITSIFQDSKGAIWIGTFVSLFKYEPDARLPHKGTMIAFEDQGPPAHWITSTIEDKDGALWFGTIHGSLSRFDGDTFIHLTEDQGLNAEKVVCLLQDKNGYLWLGTSEGLIGCNINSVEQERVIFTEFPDSTNLSGKVITCIAQDPEGNLWVGTEENGIVVYDGKSAFTLTETHGLSHNRVRSILFDRDDNLWLGTRSGLSYLSVDARDMLLNKVRSGSLLESDIFFRNFTREDGFLGVDFTVGALLEASDGTIWLGAGDRLSAFHPGNNQGDTIPPTIQVTQLKVFNEVIPWTEIHNSRDSSFVLGNGIKLANLFFDSLSQEYLLPHNPSFAFNNNDLTFSFIGVTMYQPSRVKYQYYLEGKDNNWSALTTDHSVQYGNLPPGSYTFRVKALSSSGVWSHETAYAFTIRPPFWKTWWAYGLYMLAILLILWRVHLFQRARVARLERERTRERELAQAKEIEKAYTALETTHENLKATQAQLIHSEKMASLGEMTAGIAHEIQNPLNFVNNFSEINKELLEEMREALAQGNYDEAVSLSQDLTENEEKVIQHGKRADGIVKSMLQHSRGSSGQKELTNINALCDEYLRLAYHGLRARDKTFNAEFNTDLDPDLPQLNVVPQDIGRVLLNLINNAFDACRSRQTALAQESGQMGNGTYKPEVTVSTKQLGNKVEIRVKDNGDGIPEELLKKIFQPFFTTKPTGRGTGLGLSLSYDIVKAHGGNLDLNTKEGDGTEFTITLPT